MSELSSNNKFPLMLDTGSNLHVFSSSTVGTSGHKHKARPIQVTGRSRASARSSRASTSTGVRLIRRVTFNEILKADDEMRAAGEYPLGDKAGKEL